MSEETNIKIEEVLGREYSAAFLFMLAELQAAQLAHDLGDIDGLSPAINNAAGELVMILRCVSHTQRKRLTDSEALWLGLSVPGIAESLANSPNRRLIPLDEFNNSR